MLTLNQEITAEQLKKGFNRFIKLFQIKTTPTNTKHYKATHRAFITRQEGAKA